LNRPLTHAEGAAADDDEEEEADAAVAGLDDNAGEAAADATADADVDEDAELGAALAVAVGTMPSNASNEAMLATSANARRRRTQGGQRSTQLDLHTGKAS